MNGSSIQQDVALLHREIWKQKEMLWPDRQLMPLQMLEPDAAAYLLDVEYLMLPNLGSSRFMRSGQGPGIAGLIDRQANKIAISMAYPEQVQRFTSAHEVGTSCFTRVRSCTVTVHWTALPMRVIDQI